MEGGRQKAFGPKDTVFREALKVAPPVAAAPEISVMASQAAPAAARTAGGRPS